MQPIELKLKHDPIDSLPHRCGAFAILVGSKDESELIGHLIRCATDPHLAGGTVFLLPRDSQDVTPCGIVWMAPDDQSRVPDDQSREPDDQSRVPAPLGAIALRREGSSSLWVPCDATLSPSVDDSTLAKLASSAPPIRVWLPSVGQVGFTADDAIVSSDWLVPPVANGQWRQPPDVWSPPTRLNELTMLRPPSTETFLHDLQQEIGIPPRSLADTDETGEGIAKKGVAKRLSNWLLTKLDGWAGKGRAQKTGSQGHAEVELPQGRSGPGGGGGHGFGLGRIMATLAAPAAAAMARLLQGERNQQIEKLLRMMSSNPDQALKYAIPFGGDGQGFRGFAIPGAALFARMTDFSLASLFGGGGGAADFWQIDFRLQTRLQQKYREQANREIAAGRYRRAAYIFAHLLGDYRNAAATLVRGRFFAEAAVLYRDKLNDKPAAADCLAKGGMAREAAELYVLLNRYEEAGQVWLDAGETDKATEMFERAYEVQLSRGSIVPAAVLLRDRLDRRKQATELLLQQWPGGNDVLRSCEMAIKWLGEDGRHDKMLEQMKMMEETAGDSDMADFAHLAAHAAKCYPDTAVRVAAEDQCRIAVSRSLRDCAPVQRHTVLSIIGDLDRDDLQLRRDSAEFRRRTEGQAKRHVKKSPALRKISEIQLPAGGKYVDFHMTHSTPHDRLVAISLEEDSLRVTLTTSAADDGLFNATYPVPLESLRHSQTAIFGKTVIARDQIRLRVYAAVNQPVNTDWSRNDMKHDVKIEIHPIGNVVAAGTNNSLIETINADEQSVVLVGSRGQSHDVTEAAYEAWGDDTLPIDLHEIDRHYFLTSLFHQTFFAVNKTLFMHQAKAASVHVCEGAVRDLVPSFPGRRGRLLVAHEAGLDLFNVGADGAMSICNDHGFDRCAWVDGGKIAGLSGGTLHLFDIRGRRIADIDLSSDERAVSLLNLTETTIGVAYPSGRIERFRLS